MATIKVPTTPAPSTPLNLRFDVVYAPRAAAGHAGYMAIAVGDDEFAIIGYESDGNGAELFRGGPLEAYVRLATFLGMAA